MSNQQGTPAVQADKAVNSISDADRSVHGFVDRLINERTLSGWAVNYDLPPGPLEIRVEAANCVIGTGHTGLPRRDLNPNSGFRIELTRAVSLEELAKRIVVAYAIDQHGSAHAIKVWPGLIGGSPSPKPIPAPPRIVPVVGQGQGQASGKPYFTDGTVLPPVCTATELRPAIAMGDFGRFLSGIPVATVLAHLDRDTLPIPALANRANYSRGNDPEYWLFGLDDYMKVRASWQRHTSGVKRVLDFGGSTGRVFRHFHCHGEIPEVYACDAGVTSVEWCKRYLPAEIKVFLNSIYPGLPFRDGWFDLITAFSVFTHLDEAEDVWLLELARLLKPGGIAYVTISDETTWASMTNNLKRILRSSWGGENLDFSAPMPFERKAFIYKTAGPHPGCNTFLSQSYIRRFWSQHFEIVDMIPGAHNFYQTVVILRNPG